MEAMILAAGRGERLRPITDSIPKPLVRVGTLSLIEHHLVRLSESGFIHIVINVSYLFDKIIKYLGDGSRFGVKISYSIEHAGALGTAGGILNALDLFQDEKFLVINGDIFTDFDFATLRIIDSADAKLVMVPNPGHNPDGDFCFVGDRVYRPSAISRTTFTFAGIGLYRKSLFDSLEPGKYELPQILKNPMRDGKISGEVHQSLWIDAGSIERLQQARSVAGD